MPAKLKPSIRTRTAGLVLLLGLSSCGLLVEYSDHLVSGAYGRSFFVTKPASLGGIIGFLAGVPGDIAAFPITYTIYRMQKDEEEEGVDILSTIFFPSFFLWRTGVVLVGTPLDLIEYVTYRAWARPSVTEEMSYEEKLLEVPEGEDRKKE